MELEKNKIIKNSFLNFKYNIKSMLFFEIIYKILASLVIIPLNYYILNKSLTGIGIFSITDNEFLRFGFNIKGAIGVLLIILVSTLAMFIEISALTYIANKSYKRKKASIIEASIYCTKLIPKMLSLYSIPLFFMINIIGPITSVSLYHILIKNFSINSFLKILFYSSSNAKIYYLASITLLLIIFFNSILMIPCLITENISLKRALRNSIKIFENNRFRIIYHIVLWITINIISMILLLCLYLFLGGYIIMTLGDKSPYLEPFIITYLVLFILFYIIISIIALPLFISFLTELYHKYRCYKANEQSFILYEKMCRMKYLKPLRKARSNLNIVIVFIFLLMVIVTTKSLLVNKSIDKHISITAHRGSSSKAPENSISSILQAIMDGADYTEIDVMTTKDNRVVLFHDPNLYKVNNSIVAIKDLNLEDVQKIDNGSYFSLKFKGEKIPTLEEALKIAKDKIKINIDLKILKENDALPIEVAKLIKKYQMEEQVIVSSSNYDAIQIIKAYCPKVKIGYIMNVGFGNFSALNVDFISVEYQMLTPNMVYMMHALNKEVHVWTVNSEEHTKNVIQLRVDNIITDSVDDVDQVIKNSINYDRNYLVWFYDSILAIIRYIRI